MNTVLFEFKKTIRTYLKNKDIALISPLKGAGWHDKLSLKCICGHEWPSEISNIYAGKGCLECSKVGRGLKRRIDFNDVLKVIKKKKGTLLSPVEKFSSTDKIDIECKKGHSWNVIISSILGGTWCPECANVERGERCREPIEFFIELARKNGGECLSKKTLPSGEKLKFRCMNGHDFSSAPGNVKKKWACAECAGTKKLSIEVINERVFEKYQGECISKVYEGCSKGLFFKCVKGHKFKKSWDEVKQDRWCITCKKESLSLNDYHAIARRNEGSFDGDSILALNKRLQWTCKKGHTFQATFKGAQEAWCKICFKG